MGFLMYSFYIEILFIFIVDLCYFILIYYMNRWVCVLSLRLEKKKNLENYRYYFEVF